MAWAIVYCQGMPNNENSKVCEKRYTAAYESGFEKTTRFLLSRGVPSHKAEETAQAAWARGWQRRHQIRDPRRVGTWVNSIALNMFRNRHRRERTMEELTELPTAANMGPGTVDSWRILSHCDATERQLLEKRYVLGYTSREIAKQLGWTPTAVRVRLFRVRKRIRQRLAAPQQHRARRSSLRNDACSDRGQA